MSNWNDHTIAYQYSGQILTVIVDNEYFTIGKENPSFDAAVQALRDKNIEVLIDSIKPIHAVEKVVQTLGYVRIENDNVYYHDEILHGVLVNRILEYARDGIDNTGLIMFLENLMQNPSRTAVNELFEWMEASETPCPITEDGHFLAYKKVDHNFKDLYSHSLDYSVGNIVEVPRNQVDDNRDNTCSNGLHFCSLSYLPLYWAEGYPVIIVKINPASVVSFPLDCSLAKGRTCRMEVIGVHKGSQTEPAWTTGYAQTAENRTAGPNQTVYNVADVEMFYSREDARKFVRNFGGTVVDSESNRVYLDRSEGEYRIELNARWFVI